ncbi:MAG TPA: MBL fold metallo-hydrolase [Streptosporangiaceae bacterium]|nr:MBL fold metallo-hydrolase [Streptosporangiaceae bacterium]
MRLTVVGYAGSFPGPDSPASCYLLEAEGFRMVLDLGSGALGPLQRHVRLNDVDAVCISHLHVDHYMDMCPYWVVRNYAPGGTPPPIPVYGPAGTANRLALAYGLDPDPGMTRVFDFVTLSPGRREIGPFSVTAGHVNHPVETFGFRIEYGGRALAYSADTGESATLAELARSADVLLCEASFIDRPGLPANLHLTGRGAGEHAARAGAGHLVLTHLTPGNDPACTLAEAQSAFGGTVSLASADRVIDLGGDGPLAPSAASPR